jgi:hypothetical protein
MRYITPAFLVRQWDRANFCDTANGVAVGGLRSMRGRVTRSRSSLVCVSTRQIYTAAATLARAGTLTPATRMASLRGIQPVCRGSWQIFPPSKFPYRISAREKHFMRANQEALLQKRAMNFTKNLGMLALAVYLILAGIGLLIHTFVIPALIMGILALAAGILILIGK